MFNNTKKSKLIILAIILLSFFVFQKNSKNLAAADTLASKLKGKILLQVKRNGEAWYVNPDNERRYFLGKPKDAFNVMKELGLGISEVDYNSIVKNNNIAPKRLKGKILLRVKANGKAYYVNPDDRKIHYLGRPKDAFDVMKNLGLGIADEDLNDIKIYAEHKGYPIKRNERVIKNLKIECPTSNEGYCDGNKAIVCGQLDGTVGDEWGEIQCASDQFCHEEERAMYNIADCFREMPCHEPNYNMVFVILQKADDKATPREIEHLGEIKTAFAKRFSWATRGLATMDTSHPVVVIEMEPYPLGYEVIREFYKTYPDEFDFITVYNTYDANRSTMNHDDVQNNVTGIGRGIFDNTHNYNHNYIRGRRLLGINFMMDIEQSLPEYFNHDTPEEIEEDMMCTVNGILHETAHKWGAHLDYLDENGEKQWDLRQGENNVHWSIFLMLNDVRNDTLGGADGLIIKMEHL